MSVNFNAVAKNLYLSCFFLYAAVALLSSGHVSGLEGVDLSALIIVVEMVGAKWLYGF